MSHQCHIYIYIYRLLSPNSVGRTSPMSCLDLTHNYTTIEPVLTLLRQRWCQKGNMALFGSLHANVTRQLLSATDIDGRDT